MTIALSNLSNTFKTDTFKNPYAQGTQSSGSSTNPSSVADSSTLATPLGPSNSTSDNFTSDSSDPTGTGSDPTDASQYAANPSSLQRNQQIENTLNNGYTGSASSVPQAIQEVDSQILAWDTSVLQTLQQQADLKKLSNEQNNPSDRNQSQWENPVTGATFDTRKIFTNSPATNPITKVDPKNQPFNSQQTLSSVLGKNLQNSNGSPLTPGANVQNQNSSSSSSGVNDQNPIGLAASNGTPQNLSQNKPEVYALPPTNSIWTTDDPNKTSYNAAVATNQAMEAKVEPIIQKALALGAQLFTPTTQSA